MRVTISAVSHYLPDRVMTNTELEQIVDTSDEWIQSRTGIRERHVVAEGEATSHMGIKSVEQILEKSGTSAQEIDVIIVGTVTPDMFFPSTAALVQDSIGATNAWAFDLNAACSGFLFSLETAASLIYSGRHNKALVIGGDTMTSVLDYKDRATCVLFGDGAGAVLLQPTEGDDGILDSIMFTDGSGGNRLYMPAGGSRQPATHETVDQRLHYLKQDGREVYKSAVRGMADAAKTLLERNGFSNKDVNLFIPHQANKRIIDATAKRLGLSEEQVLVNIDRVANTTAGTIPIGLSETVNEGRLA
ncbi:MAG TPA: ketoacyl-ACP synthase III, partial [Candidatus Marinimicrobia bacterium]|nr:ketoacyl-ACP synthase III [Candidatus Neomarinimicrobiota bacterium]